VGHIKLQARKGDQNENLKEKEMVEKTFEGKGVKYMVPLGWKWISWEV